MSFNIPIKISDLISQLEYIKRNYGDCYILKSNNTMPHRISTNIDEVAPNLIKLEINLE